MNLKTHIAAFSFGKNMYSMLRPQFFIFMNQVHLHVILLDVVSNDMIFTVTFDIQVCELLKHQLGTLSKFERKALGLVAE